MTCVITYVDFQPEFMDEAIALLRNYREFSRDADGNLETTVVQEAGRPNRFAVVEIWKDESSFQAHERAPTVTEFRSRLQRIHNSPYDQRVHQDFAVASVSESSNSDSVWVITHVDVPPPRREETEVQLKRLAEESRTDL